MANSQKIIDNIQKNIDYKDDIHDEFMQKLMKIHTQNQYNSEIDVSDISSQLSDHNESDEFDNNSENVKDSQAFQRNIHQQSLINENFLFNNKIEYYDETMIESKDERIQLPKGFEQCQKGQDEQIKLSIDKQIKLKIKITKKIKSFKRKEIVNMNAKNEIQQLMLYDQQLQNQIQQENQINNDEYQQKRKIIQQEILQMTKCLFKNDDSENLKTLKVIQLLKSHNNQDENQDLQLKKQMDHYNKYLHKNGNENLFHSNHEENDKQKKSGHVFAAKFHHHLIKKSTLSDQKTDWDDKFQFLNYLFKQGILLNFFGIIVLYLLAIINNKSNLNCQINDAKSDNYCYDQFDLYLSFIKEFFFFDIGILWWINAALTENLDNTNHYSLNMIRLISFIAINVLKLFGYSYEHYFSILWFTLFVYVYQYKKITKLKLLNIVERLVYQFYYFLFFFIYEVIILRNRYDLSNNQIVLFSNMYLGLNKRIIIRLFLQKLRYIIHLIGQNYVNLSINFEFIITKFLMWQIIQLF